MAKRLPFQPIYDSGITRGDLPDPDSRRAEPQTGLTAGRTNNHYDLAPYQRAKFFLGCGRRADRGLVGYAREESTTDVAVS